MKTNSKNIIYCGVFAALIVVLTMVSIPLPSGIPVTLQTFAVALCGYMLGSKWGTISVGVYVALGIVGLPVFTGFSGGIGKIAGVTGGYIWGFLLMAACCGILLKRRNPVISIAFGVLGLLLCHVCGVIQFSIVSGNGLVESAMIASVPYLIKDILSVAAAYVISVVLGKTLRKSSVQPVI